MKPVTLVVTDITHINAHIYVQSTKFYLHIFNSSELSALVYQESFL